MCCASIIIVSLFLSPLEGRGGRLAMLTRMHGVRDNWVDTPGPSSCCGDAWMCDYSGYRGPQPPPPPPVPCCLRPRPALTGILCGRTNSTGRKQGQKKENNKPGNLTSSWPSGGTTKTQQHRRDCHERKQEVQHKRHIKPAPARSWKQQTDVHVRIDSTGVSFRALLMR